jgi:hypothetical protein
MVQPHRDLCPHADFRVSLIVASSARCPSFGHSTQDSLWFTGRTGITYRNQKKCEGYFNRSSQQLFIDRSMADTLDSDDESDLERFLIIIVAVVTLLVILPNLLGVTRKTKAD